VSASRIAEVVAARLLLNAGLLHRLLDLTAYGGGALAAAIRDLRLLIEAAVDDVEQSAEAVGSSVSTLTPLLPFAEEHLQGSTDSVAPPEETTLTPSAITRCTIETPK